MKRISAFEGSLNIISSIVGSGIVGLPYAVARSGILLGTVLTLATAFAMDYSVKLLIHSALLTHTNSYPQMMKKTFGLAGLSAISTFQLLASFGGICIDLIMIRDNLGNLLFNQVLGLEQKTTALHPSTETWTSFCERRVIVPVVGFGLIFPLSLMRHVKDFAMISFVSVLGTVLLVACVFCCCCFEANDSGPNSASAHWTSLMGTPVHWIRWSGAVESIGIVSFAFICHGVVFSIYNSLKVPSPSSFIPIMKASMGVSCLMFAVLGIPGYLRFKDEVEGNILNNFSYSNPIINMVRAIFTLSLVTSIPLEIFVIREVVSGLSEGKEELTESTELEPLSMWKSCLISAIVVGGAVIIAASKTEVTDFLSVTGGVAVSGVAFVFPAVGFLRAKWRARGGAGLMSGKIHIFGALVILGFGVWILSFSMADLIRTIHNSKEYYLHW
jgi:sodium-coupled neutral amino acid transporter 11